MVARSSTRPRGARVGSLTDKRRSLVVVTYDSSDDQRRARLANALLSYGARIQLSVYELWLTAPDLEAMWHHLGRLQESGDQIRCYLLCESCERRVRSYGMESPHNDVAFFA